MFEQRQFCTFFVNGSYFGIEVQHIQEVVGYKQITHVPLAPSDICGLINLRGQIITTINLRRRLNLSESSAQSLPSSEKLAFVVVYDGDELVSLLVDEVEDILEVTQDKFEPPPKTLQDRMRQFIYGAYKLKDKLLLILNTEKILEVKSTM